MPEKNRSKNKKKSPATQALSYPIPIRVYNPQIVQLLNTAHQLANQYLQFGYNSNTLQELTQSEKKAYKVLEPELSKQLDKSVPSRVNRGVLEICGRALRTINDRKRVFDKLSRMCDDPNKWNYRKLIKEKGIYVKSQYVVNLAEQAKNYMAENDNRMPEDFLCLNKCPQMRTAILSFAADDKRIIRIENKGNQLQIELKVDCGSEDKPDWQWVQFDLPLPHFIQDQKHLAPDLRLACIHGEWLPVLDYKIEAKCEGKVKSKYFLTVDWGTRKLITICVFDKQGNQVCAPIFLKFDPLLKKLLAIRKEIDNLKSKRDKLEKDTPDWRKLNREIARRWRKYKAINKALSHLAANVIILIAKFYNCSEIYVEWLKGLKSKDKSSLLNWILNTTVRQAIYDKVEYKAKLAGIKFAKPIPPGHTSKYCPRCGCQGHHVKAPDNHIKDPRGGWFVCPNCGFNADRDYVACGNLARKVLYGYALKNQTKGVAYQAVSYSGLPFRQRAYLARGLLRKNLKGWKKSVFLTPRFYTCHLKS